MEMTRRAWGIQDRALAWVNLGALLALGLTLTALLVYHGEKRFRRFDMTATQIFALDPQVRQALSRIEREVNIYVTDIDESSDKSIFTAESMLRNLLGEFNRVNPAWINVRYLSGETSPEILLKLQAQFGGLKPGHVYLNVPRRLVEGAPGDPVTKDIPLTDLYEGDPHTGKVFQFTGEAVIATAILETVNEKPRLVYVTGGHGELFRRAEARVRTFAPAAQMMEGRLNVEFRDLAPGFTDVPSDAHVLFIPMPLSDFSPAELAAVDAYVRRGGRLFVLAVRSNTLTRALQAYGIEVSGQVLLQTERQPADAVALLRGAHASTGVEMNEQRPVAQWLTATEVHRTEIPFQEGWTIENVIQSADPVVPVPFEVVRDVVDPAAIRRAAGQAQKRGLGAAAQGRLSKEQEREARVLVWGSGYGPTVVDGIHLMMFYNALSWLLGEEPMRGIPDRAGHDIVPLIINKEQHTQILWRTAIWMPTVAALFGFGLWFIRRK